MKDKCGNIEQSEIAKHREALLGCNYVRWMQEEGKPEFREGRFFDEQVRCVDINMKELFKGIQVEKEHTKDKSMATKIALDHLAECEDYYARLKTMESECEVA